MQSSELIHEENWRKPACGPEDARGGRRRSAVTLLPAGFPTRPALAFSGHRRGRQPRSRRRSVLTAPQLRDALEAYSSTPSSRPDERSPGAKAQRGRLHRYAAQRSVDTHLKQRDRRPRGGRRRRPRRDSARARSSLSHRPAGGWPLTEISKNERTPQTPAERFFASDTSRRRSTAITRPRSASHKDPALQGSISFLAGIPRLPDRRGKDCPHCGQKAIPKSGSGGALAAARQRQEDKHAGGARRPTPRLKEAQA